MAKRLVKYKRKVVQSLMAGKFLMSTLIILHRIHRCQLHGLCLRCFLSESFCYVASAAPRQLKQLIYAYYYVIYNRDNCGLWLCVCVFCCLAATLKMPKVPPC